MATFVCLVMTSSVSVVCSAVDTESGWGTATLIETTNLGGADDPQVAVDSSGNAMVVWSQYDGIRNNIWSNRYVVGSGWGIPQVVDNRDVSAWDPQIAIDDLGNAIAVWRQYEGTQMSVWSSRYVLGIGWGQAQTIEADDTSAVSSPQIAVDGSGNAIAVWHQWDGTCTSLYSNRYAVGVGWGGVQLVETDDTGHAENAQIAADDSGNAIAVWTLDDGSRIGIWSNRYVVGTGWEVPQPIEDDYSGDSHDPQVAVDGSGNAMAVWSQDDGTSHQDVWSNRYVVGTGWGEAQLVEFSDTVWAGVADVGVDDSGNAIAVWVEWDGNYGNVSSNRYVVGTGWGEVQRIESDELLTSSVRPQIAVDGSGNATAVWSDIKDWSYWNVSSNRYVVGMGWGTEQLIDSSDAGSVTPESPRVAVDESGGATVVWSQYDGTCLSIWANRYVVPDITPPSLSLVTPADGLTTETPVVTASGTTESGVSLVVNGISVAVESDGSFSCEIALLEGENTITTTATDASDNSATVSVSVTYVNPVRELEEELSDALEELIIVQDELSNALDELAVLLDELDGTQDELDSLEDDLETTKDDLDAIEEELDATKDELNTTQADLGSVEDELSATQDDLASAEEELSSTSDDLESVKSQNIALMVVLAIVAILAVVMSAMFMSLRKKIAGMDVKAADEEPPPPQS